MKRLANDLGVTEDSIETAVQQFHKTSTVSQPAVMSAPKQERDTFLEEYLLSLIIQSHEPAQYLAKAMAILSLEDFREPPVSKIIEQLVAFLKTHKQFEAKIYSKLITAEVMPTFDRAYLRDMSHLIANVHDFDKEFTYVIKQLRKISIRRRINNLSTKLRLAEKKDQSEEAKSYNEDLRSLLKEMGKLDKSN